MNTVITSKEAILTASRKIAIEKGLYSINMREVAKVCGVALGSVYNYFPSKADLVTATTEDIWKSIFGMNDHCESHGSFVDCVQWLFNSVYDGTSEYPRFFTVHSLGLTNAEKTKGRIVMNKYFEHMKDGLLVALQNDANIKERTFDDRFTQEAFVDFVFSSLIALLLKGEDSCCIIIEMIRRSIY
ncbi:TetR/AcrR family transcriptional regulator [Caproiciproducens sp.]|uniref:TetR/AcrR family transcriptional regulator n=1 Tax=Caproiciproducens sp. TaxID=1954376 RepID=UPI0028A04F40|nr:TetR/AcrR family transcriptional regulator [Caproiciproducens sp.]